MASTEDGFLLAEADLAQRGAGHLLGARQAGSRDLRIADPLRDKDLLLAARAEAEAWLATLPDAELARDPLLKSIARRWTVAADKSAAG
jgi:ATP-dependent DNA helicase RecG